MSVMAKLPPGTYGTSDTPRPGAYGIIPVGRSAEPLDGCSCNLASICICCSRILFLLWSTLVRWPVYPGRMQTGFCRRHDDYVPSSVTRGRPARHVFECFWKTRGQNIQNQPRPKKLGYCYVKRARSGGRYDREIRRYDQ